jgi:thymidylate synthase ThyX
MKLIKQSFEFINQTDFSLVGIKKHIERCARVSYKSENKITDTSYEKFVNMLESRGHDRPLEFGTVYLSRTSQKEDNMEWLDKYAYNPWSKFSFGNGSTRINRELRNTVYVTTNYRVIKEHHWEDDLQYLCEPTEYHHKRYTVHMILDRGVMDEFRTHVGLSHLAESTRYCVSGDTLLKYKNPNNHYTIKELWEDKQNKNKLSQVLIEVLNIDTGILEHSKIKNIFNNGIRKVYKITTELGYSLKCTLDHQIYTPNDWKSLSELKIGDKIYVNGSPIYQNKDWLEYHYLKLNKTVTEICEEFNFKSDVIRKWLHKYNIVKPKLEKQLYQDYDWLYNQNITLNKTFVDIGKEFGINVSTLKKWAKKLGIPNKGTGYFNVGRTPWNKGKTEFDDERVANALRTYHHDGDSTEKILKEDTSRYQKYIKSSCEICGATKDLEVHHKDKNHSNNNPNNLMTVCSSCHQQIHYQSLTSLYGDKIIAITELGEEEVFDLEIENYHNYVANGIIVHNCNYSKDKFGREVTFIKPCWLDIPLGDYGISSLPGDNILGLEEKTRVFINSLLDAEDYYLTLLGQGWTPQQARSVLPLGIKSELISCGFEDAWANFMRRRSPKYGDPGAHPMAAEIADKLCEEFLKRGFIDKKKI